MKKQLRIFVTGALVVIPFAVTAWVAWWAATQMARLGQRVLPRGPEEAPAWMPWAGVAAILAVVYLIGLLMHWCVFRWIVGLLERLLGRLPIVKTLYESVRDILRLFSGEAQQMGQVVRYRLPGTDAQLLGIQTSTSPRGADAPGKVAVYLPMSYQIGGFTLYLPADAVEPVDMSVEEALKLAATAEAGAARETPGPETGGAGAGGEQT